MSENWLRESEVRRFAWILLVLTGLFVFRVVAQLIQVWHPVAFLPSFETWQSGAFPYPLLLGFQVTIVGLCLRVVWRMFRGAMLLVQKKGKILLYLGGLYIGVMGIRLVVGLTVAPDHFWFGARLPTLFHFVLAAFLLAYGRFHVSVANPSNPVHQEATV
jgi:hypothetical protein